MHVKGVDVPASGSVRVSREMIVLTLGEKNRGVDPDHLVRVQFVTAVDMKLAHAKLGERMNISQKSTYDR